MLKCNNCGFQGHPIDRCFKLIGYPPNWKGAKVSRSNCQAHQQSQGNGTILYLTGIAIGLMLMLSCLIMVLRLKLH